MFSPETGLLAANVLAAPQAGVERSLADTVARVLRHPPTRWRWRSIFPDSPRLPRIPIICASRMRCCKTARSDSTGRF